MSTLKPRPYESGSSLAEFHENATGDTAETFGVTNVVPVVVTDAVRVEEHPPRYITTDQVPVTDVASRVLTTNRARASVTLTAVAVDVYIGGEGVTPGTGFLLRAGAYHTITANGTLYAVAAAGASSVLSVLSEYRDA